MVYIHSSTVFFSSYFTSKWYVQKVQIVSLTAILFFLLLLSLVLVQSLLVVCCTVRSLAELMRAAFEKTVCFDDDDDDKTHFFFLFFLFFFYSSSVRLFNGLTLRVRENDLKQKKRIRTTDSATQQQQKTAFHAYGKALCLSRFFFHDNDRTECACLEKAGKGSVQVQD